MSPENSEENEEMIEKAKQLLLLTDLIDKYPVVVGRRVAGLVYIIIAGGISFTTLTFMFLLNILGPGDPFLLNLGFVFLSLFFSWIVAFRLIVPLTRSYPQQPQSDVEGKYVFAVWGILGAAIVVVSLILFPSGMTSQFPPVLQSIMGTGFLSNYLLARKSVQEGLVTREHFYFALVTFLSIIPMLMFPIFSYVLLVVVDMGGIYVIGIYMLVTAEQLLLESKGQG
ncbi:MAG: hypothetical protein OEV85_03395 [Candidatus Thorarchaeota archaeon]|nr:hypothetical protein [Candidatus Thorarchaeota archaeon]